MSAPTRVVPRLRIGGHDGPVNVFEVTLRLLPQYDDDRDEDVTWTAPVASSDAPLRIAHPCTARQPPLPYGRVMISR
jgi:hypothetical protein